MHEMSLAYSIVEILLEEIQNQKESIKEVYLKASSLHQIVPESLIFYYDIIKKDYEKLKDSVLIIEKEEIKVRCRNCGKTYYVENLFFLCEDCQSGVDIIEGNELYIDKIIV